MPKYNACLIMGKLCKYADVFGDCKGNKRYCDSETPFILNDDYSTQLEDYLDYDLLDEEEELL